MTPEGTAAMSAASNRRSSGLDSLFSSTAEEAPREEVASSDSRANRAFSAGSVAGERESSMVNATTAFGHRQLQVIRPMSYNDAEAVVRALKAGEVAVLNMNNVDSALAKRVLDFAFGAACALGANVEVPSKGVYAVAIGAALSESEKSDLSGRGVF
jgi:cell division inhibitor SepF